MKPKTPTAPTLPRSAGYGGVPKPDGKHIAVGAPKTKTMGGRRSTAANPAATKAGC